MKNKESFFICICIIAIRLLSNHSPSEWFSIYNKKGLSQNGKHLRQVLFMPMNAKQMDI